MNKDKALRRLLQSIDIRAVPPEGLRERIFGRVMLMEVKSEPRLSLAERFFFEKPLQAACVIAVPVTGFLWAVTGGDFIGLLSGLIH